MNQEPTRMRASLHVGPRLLDVATSRPNAAARLSRLAAFVGLALIFYLPLEPTLLLPLPGAAYWLARLLPDAVIGVLALAALWIDRGKYSTAHRLTYAILGIGMVITLVTVARGQSAVDAVNAQRVLVRYPLLGLVLWRSITDVPTLPRNLLRVIVLAGVVQVVVGLAVVTWTALMTGSVANAYLLAGTVGRYDRLGPVLVAMVLALLVWGMASGWRAWYWPLLFAAAMLLYLSTSRQAMVLLAVGAAAATLFPRISRRLRFLSLMLACAAAVMILLTPTSIASPPGAPDGDGAGISGPATPVPSGGSIGAATPAPPTPRPIIKGGTALSTSPTRNFRLFLLLRVTPWAAVQEPLIGFGPGQQAAAVPDPRLQQFMTDSGLEWSTVSIYMNDSQYASLVIQFGVPVTMAVLGLLLWSLVVVTIGAMRYDEPLTRFSLLFGFAAMAGATFGPFFESRTDSIVLWLPLLAAVGLQSWLRSPGATTRKRVPGRSLA